MTGALPEQPEPDRCPEVWLPPDLLAELRAAETARDHDALDHASRRIEQCDQSEGHRGNHTHLARTWPAASDELLASVLEPPDPYDAPAVVVDVGDQCPACDLPREVPGDGRYCGNCEDFEGTCAADHCMTCGIPT